MVVSSCEDPYVWGKGEGKTVISAFDKALVLAGIHNSNLIHLSSVIPPGVEVYELGRHETHGKTGDILYVVLSSFSSNKANARITAGLGWVQTDQGGLFFESKGECSLQECEEEIRKGLGEMMATRGWDGRIGRKVITHTVEQIANVTVAAVYVTENSITPFLRHRVW